MRDPVEEPAGRRRTLIACLALAAAAAAFRLPRLATPPVLIYDEMFFVPTAQQYLEGLPPYEMAHPPLAKLLIAASIFCFGDGPIGWRLPSALAGILLAPALYLLALRALGSERAAWLSASLFLLDGQYLLQSRLATTNVPALLFEVTAAWLLVGAAATHELGRGALLGAAAALGLGLSTRWTVLPLGGFLLLVLVVLRRERLLRGRELMLLLAAGTLIAAIYLASYFPWLAQGHAPTDLVQLHEMMMNYHKADPPHPYASRWYTWPWLYRPPLYLYERTGESGEWVVILMAIGNPALWWLSVPAALGSLAWGIRKRDPRGLFCAVGFAFTYLVWAVSPRRLQFTHYFLSAMPFACLSLGLLLDRAWDGRWRWVCRAYVALAASLFLHFYPLQTALPIPSDWFFHRLFDGVYPWRWFSSWYERAA